MLTGAMHAPASEVALAILALEDALERTFEVDELAEEDLLTVLAATIDASDVAYWLTVVVHDSAEQTASPLFDLLPPAAQEASLANVERTGHGSCHHAVAGIVDQELDAAVDQVSNGNPDDGLGFGRSVAASVAASTVVALGSSGRGNGLTYEKVNGSSLSGSESMIVRIIPW